MGGSATYRRFMLLHSESSWELVDIGTGGPVLFMAAAPSSLYFKWRVKDENLRSQVGLSFLQP